MDFISEYFSIKTEPEPTAYEYLNKMFKMFFEYLSWPFYLIAVLIIMICIFYYFQNLQEYFLNYERRHQRLSLNERTPQKRRPGAVARTHEVLQNIMKEVNKQTSENTGETLECSVSSDGQKCNYNLRKSK